MLLLSTLQQFDIELPFFLLYLAASAALLLWTLGFLCAPMLAVKTETLYLVRRKAFYDKCALQISQGGLLAACIVVLLLGTLFTLFFLYQEAIAPNVPVPPVDLVWRPAVLAAPLVMCLILFCLYRSTWKALKQVRVLHVFLGIVAAVFCLATLFTGLVTGASLRQPLLFTLLWTDTLRLLHVLVLDFLASPFLWIALAYLYCLGMASASAFAQLWLIVRRRKDDYGRDYYAFAMRYCTAVAALFALAAAALTGLFFWELHASVPMELRQPEDPAIMLIAYGLPLLSCLLWFCAAKSATPMRHKPGVVFAGLFLFVGLGAQMIMLINAFPLM